MPTITITGDTTQEALENVLMQGIGKFGKEFNVRISNNLCFENQNRVIKKLREINSRMRDIIVTRIDNDKKMLDKFKKSCKATANPNGAIK